MTESARPVGESGAAPIQASRSPHRHSHALALSLRAGRDGSFILSQAAQFFWRTFVSRITWLRKRPRPAKPPGKVRLHVEQLASHMIEQRHLGFETRLAEVPER